MLTLFGAERVDLTVLRAIRLVFKDLGDGFCAAVKKIGRSFAQSDEGWRIKFQCWIVKLGKRLRMLA